MPPSHSQDTKGVCSRCGAGFTTPGAREMCPGTKAKSQALRPVAPTCVCGALPFRLRDHVSRASHLPQNLVFGVTKVELVHWVCPSRDCRRDDHHVGGD